MAERGARPERALILVRNTVTHDARIQREAAVLRELGYDVLIAGVVSTEERARRLELGGVAVLRLDPLGLLKRVARRPATQAPAPGRPGSEAPSSSLTPAPRANHRTRAARLALTAAYYLQGIGLALRRRPALVHANDYNTMWIGIAAKRLRGSALVYDCHELWPDRNRRPEWRPWLIACEWLFVRVADAVITTSPGYADEMARRYRVPRPTVVRNIPSNPHSTPPAPADGSRVVAYVGGLLPGRGLEQAIRALAHAPEVRLRLVGPGSDAYRDDLRRCGEGSDVGSRLELRDPVPPAQLLDQIADAAAGLMLIEPVCRSYELTLPNKLFEYAAAGLPILTSDLPVIGAAVRSDGLGEVVAVDDPASIARGMQRILDPERNARIREQVRAFSARETWEREREVLAGVYRALAADEQRRVRQTYAGYAESEHKRRSWDAANPGNAAIREELVQAVSALAGEQLRRARTILDVGCGTGWWLERIAGQLAPGAELHGLDLLPERVSAARERVPGATIQAADARRLPYDDRSFDVVSMFTVLSSLSSRRDALAALGEARRVLAPGGLILIWEPRIPNPLNRNTLLIDRRLVHEGLPGLALELRSLTLLPPLARRLGLQAYSRLARVPALRTHRLVCARA